MAKRRNNGPNRTATRRPDLRAVPAPAGAAGNGVHADPGADPGPGTGPGTTGLPVDAALAASVLDRLHPDPPDADVPDDDKELREEIAEQVAVVAATLVEEVARCRRPLEVELLIGDLLGSFDHSAPDEEDPAAVAEAQEFMFVAMAELLGAAGGAGALAALRGLAALGPAPSRAVAAVQADRLAATGLPEPRWATTIGRPRFVRAWLYGDVFGEQTSVGLLFEYSGREHALLTLIDHQLGGGVKDCFHAEGADAVRLRNRTAEGLAHDDDAFFEDITAHDAVEELSQALALEPCPVQDDQLEDLPRYLHLLWSRTALLAEQCGLPAPAEVGVGVELPAVPDKVLRVKVSLAGIRPPVWRRLELPARLTMAQVHDVLQAAFGWEDYHQHAFEVPVGPLPAGRGRLPAEPLPAEAEPETLLGHWLEEPGDEIVYRYDFGDDWEHRIVVESCDDPVDSVAYPRCTGGRRSAPPEDCGGVPGYERLVQALADPDHPEHDELVAWAPPGFDPAAFSARAVDVAVAALG